MFLLLSFFLLSLLSLVRGLCRCWFCLLFVVVAFVVGVRVLLVVRFVVGVRSLSLVVLCFAAVGFAPETCYRRISPNRGSRALVSPMPTLLVIGGFNVDVL